MNVWHLPKTIIIGGKTYNLNTDYRDILEIIEYLTNESKPLFLRWEIAIGLFYEEKVPNEYHNEAIRFLNEFIGYGAEEGTAGRKLIDWEQDAQLIIGDINANERIDIRSVDYMHWWTFLDKFNGISEGRLSTVVSIRSKLSKGQKLEKWEREYYQKNKKIIDFRKRYTQGELEEIENIKKWL